MRVFCVYNVMDGESLLLSCVSATNKKQKTRKIIGIHVGNEILALILIQRASYIAFFIVFRNCSFSHNIFGNFLRSCELISYNPLQKI